jgi:hypothetical protein
LKQVPEAVWDIRSAVHVSRPQQKKVTPPAMEYSLEAEEAPLFRCENLA